MLNDNSQDSQRSIHSGQTQNTSRGTWFPSPLPLCSGCLVHAVPVRAFPYALPWPHSFLSFASTVSVVVDTIRSSHAILLIPNQMKNKEIYDREKPLFLLWSVSGYQIRQTSQNSPSVVQYVLAMQSFCCCRCSIFQNLFFNDDFFFVMNLYSNNYGMSILYR